MVASDYEAGGLAISAVAALRGYRLATEQTKGSAIGINMVTFK